MENINIDFRDTEYLQNVFPNIYKCKTIDNYIEIISNLKPSVKEINGFYLEKDYTDSSDNSYLYILQHGKIDEELTCIKPYYGNFIITSIYFLKDEYIEIVPIDGEISIYTTIEIDNYRKESWHTDIDKLARDKILEDTLDRSKKIENTGIEDNILEAILEESKKVRGFNILYNYGDKEICINGEVYVRHNIIKPYILPELCKHILIKSSGILDFYIEFIYGENINDFPIDYFWNKEKLWCCNEDNTYLKARIINDISIFEYTKYWDMGGGYDKPEFNILPINFDVLRI